MLQYHSSTHDHYHNDVSARIRHTVAGVTLLPVAATSST